MYKKGSVASKFAIPKHLHLSAKKEMFKGYFFSKSIILHAVYLKLRFSLSYRDIEELLAIRGVKVDHETIQRWVFKFAPLVELQAVFVLLHLWCNYTPRLVYFLSTKDGAH